MKNESLTKDYDLIVIGGGPAGMMAAGRAAERGARVLLLEKNATLGKKLRITGGGRCNVTNAEFNTRTLLTNYGASAKFLFSAFAQYSVQDTLDFFNDRALPTKIEAAGRVFPVTDSAESVTAVMEAYVQEGMVTVLTEAAIKNFIYTHDTITGIVLSSGETLVATHYVLATGGLSRPETGSTGDGFLWLKNFGHTIATPDVSLVPISLNDTWVPTLAGLTLPEVKISVQQNGKAITSKVGRLLFTHVGVSGPTILNLSKVIGEYLAYDPVLLILDLFPAIDHGTLDLQLITQFQDDSNKQFKNMLSQLLQQRFAQIVVEQSGILPETPCHSITKAERRKLVHLLKAFPLSVQGLLGSDKAIITSGGVVLPEVDFKTMQSRLIKNLSIVGDLLNIDRPSGGYSLQLCWTTGYVAGNAVPITNPTASQK